MRHAALILALAACSLNREVAHERESEHARTTQGTQEQHSATTTVVGPTETVAIEADFGPTEADAGVESVDVPIPLPDGGTRMVAVRPPPGRAVTHFRAAVTTRAPTVATGTTDSKGSQQTAATGKVDEKDDSKLNVKGGFSLATKLTMLLGIAAVLVGGLMVLRRVPTAALGAVPVAGPALAFLGGLIKPKE